MSRGLTLMELVIAMAIFALVAVMGLQSLSGSLLQRDRLTMRADAAEALGQGLALLRNDLSAALPMVFFPPGEARPQSALRGWPDGQGFSLSLGGQPGLPRASGDPDAGARQRVDWRFDPGSGRLVRQAWPTLYPVAARQRGPGVTALEGVTALSLRSFWVGRGWVAGLRNPGGGEAAARAGSVDGDSTGLAPESYSSELPRAMEVTLETQAFGRIVLVEYLQ